MRSFRTLCDLRGQKVEVFRPLCDLKVANPKNESFRTMCDLRVANKQRDYVSRDVWKKDEEKGMPVKRDIAKSPG